MMIYYYELPFEYKPDYGQFKADNDEKAREYLLGLYPDAWCLYKESDTKDGTPFIVIYERKDQ